MRFSVYPSNPRLVSFFLDEAEFTNLFGNCQHVSVSFKDDRIFFTPGTIYTGNKVSWSWHEGARYCRFGFSLSRLGEPKVPYATSRDIPYEETADGLVFSADAISARDGDEPAERKTTAKRGPQRPAAPLMLVDPDVSLRPSPVAAVAAVTNLPALLPTDTPPVRQTADAITDDVSAVKWALDMLNGLGAKLGLEYVVRDNRIRAVMRTEL